MTSLPPPVDSEARIPVPRVREDRLSNGMRTIFVRQSNVPRIQVRLRMPGGKAHDTGNANRARLVPEVLFGGTADRSGREIAVALQSMGANLNAHTGVDDLVITGSALSSESSRFLSLLAECAWNAAYPRSEVDLAKAQMAQQISVEMAQPSSIARQKLLRSVYGRHPYGRELPPADSVFRVGSGTLRDYASRILRPREATLVIVGDVTPASIRAGEAFRAWRGRPDVPRIGPPAFSAAGETLLVSRPGAVQTNIRIAGPAVGRGHPDYFKLSLANTIFGGYFSSRLVENIREEKGYTYSPRTSIEHHKQASIFYLSADVGTEVTAPALMEIRYELTRMATTLPTPGEIESARRYLTGLTALSIQTQSGIADYIDMLWNNGLDTGYLKSFKRRLAAVTAEDIREVSAEYLAPRNLTTVLVGDADLIAPSLEAVVPFQPAG